jgi:branched-chain amino acid transport system permease protein
MNPTVSTVYLLRSRLRLFELLPWMAAIGFYVAAPEYLALGTRILIFIIAALGLDLLVGYTGVVTLGHSAYFGLGAYTAGILSVSFGVGHPLLQLVAGAGVAGVLGLLTGAFFLRTTGLTFVMLTLAFSAICTELANRATFLTGGADGLSGVTVNPLFGLFRFDLFGRTAYSYALVVLFIVWLLMRAFVYSPLGASLAGIRDNPIRMEAIGAPVYRRLVWVYGLSAAIAGTAGALLTQTNQFVGLNTLGFELSGELLVMLVFGGVGRLYGAFLGPVVYLLAQDQLAKQFPENWYLGIGLLLIVSMLFAQDGLLGIADQVARAGCRLLGRS